MGQQILAISQKGRQILLKAVFPGGGGDSGCCCIAAFLLKKPRASPLFPEIFFVSLSAFLVICWFIQSLISNEDWDKAMSVYRKQLPSSTKVVMTEENRPLPKRLTVRTGKHESTSISVQIMDGSKKVWSEGSEW